MTVLQSTIAQASTDTYTSMLKVKATEVSSLVTIVLANLHASRAIAYKILVSNDKTGSSASFAEDIAEATLNGATTKMLEPSVGFEWYDIQIKSNVAGNPATVSAWMKGQ